MVNEVKCSYDMVNEVTCSLTFPPSLPSLLKG
jgi:hypothetical protein